MGADSAPASSSTVEHGGFTFNGTGAAEAVEAIKADEAKKVAKGEAEEKPKGKAALSAAASEMGKQGGKAAAEARAAKAEKPKAEPANTEKEAKETAEPEKKAAPAEEDEDELANHPRAKARVEEKAREAKAAREEAQRERDHRIKLETRLEALERSAPRAEAERRPAAAEATETDEPQLDTYLAKHGAGGESKALSEWVNERDKWRDGQRERQSEATRHFNGLRSKQGAVMKAVGEVMKSDPEYWPAVQDIAEELTPTQGINVKTGEPFHVERPGPMNWLADELHDMPETAPLVMRYLSENRDDLATIKSYRSEKQVTRAVALIVAHTGRATAGEPRSDERPVSKPATSMAPPPVRPVTGAPSSASGADPMPREGESFDSWNRRTGGKKTASR